MTHVNHLNVWFPAVYMSYTSQNFRLFHVSNLSVRNFRIFLLMYPGSMRSCRGSPRWSVDKEAVNGGEWRAARFRPVHIHTYTQ